MGRPAKWVLGKFRIIKLRVYEDKIDRYKQILKAQNKTMQQDLEDHINRVISGQNN